MNPGDVIQEILGDNANTITILVHYLFPFCIKLFNFCLILSKFYINHYKTRTNHEIILMDMKTNMNILNKSEK